MQVGSRFVFVSTLCLLTIASGARASTIVFDGGAPNHDNIFFSDTDYSWTAETNNTQPFSVPDLTITGANWWGGCVADAGGGRSAGETAGTPAECTAVPVFTMTFYREGNGLAPGTVVTSLTVMPTQTLTGATINGAIEEYKYSVSFDPIALSAGTYLFGLSASLGGNLTWGWETTPSGEAQHFQFNSSDTTEGPVGEWHAPINALGFTLIGPED